MMQSLFIGNVFCIVLSWLCHYLDKRWKEYTALLMMIAITVFMKNHIAMSCLLGYGIGLLNEEQEFNRFRRKSFLIGLLVCSLFLMCWGHHLIYLLVNSCVVALPKSLDAVAKWLAIYSAVFVFALSELDGAKKVLTQNYLVKLGTVSMGIYCFHNIMISTIGYYVSAWLYKLGCPMDMSCIVTLMSVVLSTIIMAGLYEKSIGKRIAVVLVKLK